MREQDLICIEKIPVHAFQHGFKPCSNANSAASVSFALLFRYFFMDD